jgi:hypothetical protein
MAGVFKNLDASDIRITPFQTHKTWNDSVSYEDYYSSVNANPINVGGLFRITNRAYATDVSSSRILSLNSSANYQVVATLAVPQLSGSKYGIETRQQYITAYGTDGSFATISMISSSFTSQTGSFYTSSIVRVPYDISSTITASTGSLIYVAGTGGVSALRFNSTAATIAGFFVGSEQTITNLADQSLTASFYAVNGEGKAYNDRVLAVSVTGSNAYVVTMSGSINTNALVVAGSSSISLTSPSLPQKFLWSRRQNLYFLLLQNGNLYRVTSNASASLAYTNVLDILQDQPNFVPLSLGQRRDTKIHILFDTGVVGLDYVAASGSTPTSIDREVDVRRWISGKPQVKATIQYNIESGSIGILAGSTSSLDESVFFTINPNNYEVSDPIHLGATKGDLRISGIGLNAFVGFSSSYNNRFAEFNLDTTTFQQYKANYNPTPSHESYNPLDVNFDEGSPTFDVSEPITAKGKYQRVVHQSIDHLYYRRFYDNTKATFGSGNINTQDRFLEDQAQIINLPQSKFGEAIQQGSVTIAAKYSISQSNNNNLTIVDDLYGNLYVSGGFISPINGTTLVTGSISSSTVGEWPTLELYKFNTKGPATFTSSFNKGNWQMQTNYYNVSFASLVGSSIPIPSPVDLLGVVPHFTSSISSSITIQPGPVQDYKQNYNFENGDFTITMMLKADATSSHTSGSVVLAKQGPQEDTAVDINGNPYTYNTDNRSPYRLIVSSSYQLLFERDNLLEQVRVSGSLTQNKLHHITAMKTGSELRLYVDGVLANTTQDVSIPKGCSNKSNITIGNSFTQDRGFDGVIDNIKVYNKALNDGDVQLSYHTLGVNNTIVGNVFYNQGMMVLGSIPARFMDLTDVTVRGTHTIWEKEISCTVGAGEFNRSNNPTLQTYNPATNQYEFKSFTTGSFKPYVTSVGLYDDAGRMVAVAKLATPLQLPDNVDTTIVVRYDS